MTPKHPRPWLLLLDRDGTLMADVGYPSDPEQVQLIPGAAAAVRDLVRYGYRPAVVSNQSGLARGLIAPEQAAAVHHRFVELFEAESGVRLPCYYCPHGPDDGCECRKPKPGLLRRAAAELGCDVPTAHMIGDKPSDVAAGVAAGCYTVWLAFGREYPPEAPRPTHVMKGWKETAAALGMLIMTFGVPE